MWGGEGGDSRLGTRTETTLDNKIEIVREYGGYTWRVLTPCGTLLCSGHCADRRDAAIIAITWIEGQP